jgi:hypothetical protein
MMRFATPEEIVQSNALGTEMAEAAVMAAVIAGQTYAVPPAIQSGALTSCALKSAASMLLSATGMMPRDAAALRGGPEGVAADLIRRLEDTYIEWARDIAAQRAEAN